MGPSLKGRRSLARSGNRRNSVVMPLNEIIHQCPYCELRFNYMAEVKDHVMHDHKEHAESFEGVQVTELPHT